MALEVGSRLGHYDVTALIGEGGMGQVYQATDTKLNRQVALKILRRGSGPWHSFTGSVECRRLAGTLGIWLLACGVLAAADFWDDKYYTSWSAEEVEQMLTDSPWSRAITVVLPGAALGDGAGGPRANPDDIGRLATRDGVADYLLTRETTRYLPRRRERLPSSTVPPRMTLTVSWRSALPVKQALARAQAGIGAPIPPAQQAFLIQYEPLYIVSVAGIPRQLTEGLNQQALLAETILARKDKQPIVAEDVEPFFESDETVILEFAFLRDDAITLLDREVKFVTKLGDTEIERSFELQDMMFGDALAM